MHTINELFFDPVLDFFIKSPTIETQIVKDHEQVLKHILVDYAQGTTRQETQQDLKKLTETLLTNARNIYSSINLDDKESAIFDQDIYALLTSFNIDISENIYTSEPLNLEILSEATKHKVHIKQTENQIIGEFYKQIDVDGVISYEIHRVDLVALDIDIDISNNQELNLNQIIANNFKSILEQLHLAGYNISPDANSYTKLIYKSKNLYQLLRELSYSNVHDVEYLLMQINAARLPNSLFKHLLIITGITSLTTYFLDKFRYQPIIKFFEYIFEFWSHLDSVLSFKENLPLFSLIWQGVLLGFLLNRFIFTGVKLDHYRVAGFIFQTIQIGLRITAYTFLYITQGIVHHTIGSLAAPLFIVAAVMDLIQCLYYPFISLFKSSKSDTTFISQHNVWLAQSLKQRDEYHHLTRESFLTPVFFWNLASACAITAIIAIGLIFPPSLSLIAMCVILPLLISAIKDYMVNRQINYDIDQRQEKIHKLSELGDKPQRSPLRLFFPPQNDNISTEDVTSENSEDNTAAP